MTRHSTPILAINSVMHASIPLQPFATAPTPSPTRARSPTSAEPRPLRKIPRPTKPRSPHRLISIDLLYLHRATISMINYPVKLLSPKRAINLPTSSSLFSTWVQWVSSPLDVLQELVSFLSGPPKKFDVYPSLSVFLVSLLGYHV